LIDFTKIGTDVRSPQRKNEVVRGSISHHHFPYFVTRQSERSGYQQRLLQTFAEDVFIFSLLVYIAH